MIIVNKDELTEKAHIAKVGAGPYARAFAWALYTCKQDARLLGLGKIRNAIAKEAALQASGFPVRPFKLPKRAGKATEEMQRICEEILPKAIEAAKEHLHG
jgi:hypothetical protein